MSATATFCFYRFLFTCFFVEVRELIGTQQNFTTLCYSFVAGFITLIHGNLYRTGFESSIESTFFFYSQEKLPCLFGNGYCQIFDIIRTCSRVNHFIEMRLFFQQQLLITGHTLREFIRSLISFVKRDNRHWIYTCQSSTHRLCLCTQQVHMSIKQSEVESRSFGMYPHLGSATTFAVCSFIIAIAQTFGIIGSYNIGP